MTNKNHTTLVYESSDAIVINTVEKQETVSFEEPEITTRLYTRWKCISTGNAAGHRRYDPGR